MFSNVLEKLSVLTRRRSSSTPPRESTLLHVTISSPASSCSARIERYRPLSRLGCHPNPTDPLTESPFPLEQRLDSQGNSDIPRALLGPDLHFPSPAEPDTLLEELSVTEHSRSHAPSSSGSANRYNRGVAPSELPPPMRSRVKRDITSPESPSLRQDPTDAPYSSSPPSNRPISTLSSIRTSRVSVTESPNLTKTFTESENHGKSTNGITGRCYDGWCCHQ